MSIVESLVLGTIQGLTEFIPISSSGHLVIAQYFMSGASDHLFLEWINVGTLLALLIFFRQKIITILRQIVTEKDYRLASNVLIAALPAAFAGFVLAGFIEDSPFFGSPWTVAVTLALVGIVLIMLEKLPKKQQTTESTMSKSRASTIGIVQMVALVPGTSRSGSTIIAGRLMGLTPAAAAEFSFLMSIPIMCGVVAKLLLKSSDRAYLLHNLTSLTIGNLAALVFGLLSVGFLMRYLQHKPLAIFGWYRVGLSAILVAILLLQ